jgi:aspartate/methionine/tyrosine aminotransferase
VRRFDRLENERFALDPDRALRALTSDTRAVVVTNLHNPSGARASDEALRAIARALEPRGGHLVVDEVYASFDALAGDDGVFRASARKLAPNIVTTSSLTKCYGLGNHRFGWVLAPPGVVTRADDAITASCGMLPLSHANLAAHAFERVPFLASRARSLLHGKRERVAAWVASQPHLRWSEPHEGLFGFVTTAKSDDLTPIIERGVDDHGVLVAAGSFFEIPNGFRISWSIAGDKLDDGLARLARVIVA